MYNIKKANKREISEFIIMVLALSNWVEREKIAIDLGVFTKEELQFLNEHYDEMMSVFNPEDELYDLCSSYFTEKKKYFFSKIAEEKVVKPQPMLNKKQIHIWTDGSSINNGDYKGCGGHGYVLLFGDFDGVDLNAKYCDDSKTLTGWGASDIGEHSTNQREEIKSVVEGLKRIVGKGNEVKHKIQVFSDSAYLVNCMNEKWYDNWLMNGWKNSKKKPVENVDVWKELLAVINDNFLDISFNKTTGHSKVYYNELADKLAKQGLEESKQNRGKVAND